MWRQVLGGLVGGEIQRHNGGNGLKGMVIGSLAMRAMTRMGPIGWIVGAAWAAKKFSDRQRADADDAAIPHASGPDRGPASRRD